MHGWPASKLKKVTEGRPTMNKFALAVILISSCLLLSMCQPRIVGIAILDEPYDSLSEYHFFDGPLSDLSPTEGVLPYDLNSPLFSDYARKSRFVWMPEGSSATYNTDHVLDFPLGTVLIKNFFYQHDETDVSKGRRIMETRLLINRGEEWDAYGYIWNDAQTEAVYDVVGDIKEVSWINTHGTEQDVNYIIPNKKPMQGMSCLQKQTAAYRTKGTESKQGLFL